MDKPRFEQNHSKHKSFVKHLYNVGSNVFDVGPALYKCLCLPGQATWS